MKVIGLILIIAGIAMLIFKSVTVTKKEKVVDLGPVEINREKPETIRWPYYTGGLAIVAGIVLVIAGKKKE